MKTTFDHVRKPRGLTDEEWIAILRAWGQTYWQYVFGSFHSVYVLAILLIILFCRSLPDAFDGDARWHFEWLYDYDFLRIVAWAFLILFGLRSYERKTARAAGL